VTDADVLREDFQVRDNCLEGVGIATVQNFIEQRMQMAAVVA